MSACLPIIYLRMNLTALRALKAQDVFLHLSHKSYLRKHYTIVTTR